MSNVGARLRYPEVVSLRESVLIRWRWPHDARLKVIRQTALAWTALPLPTQLLVRATTITAMHEAEESRLLLDIPFEWAVGALP